MMTDGERRSTATNAPGNASFATSEVGQRLATAAGLAGLLFAVTDTVAFVLFRVGIPPASEAAFLDWWAASRDRIVVAAYVMPFAGIAFMWFVAAVRERVGHREGRFFSTLFLGSALLYVATLLVVAAVGGATVVASQSVGLQQAREMAAFSHALAYSLFFGFTVKMGGMFMLVTSTLGRGSSALPQWLVLVTLALGLTMLIGNLFWEPTALVFPGWVAVVSVLLIRYTYLSGRAGTSVNATAPDPGPERGPA